MTDPVPKGHRTTATLSKGRWSVKPCDSAAPVLAGLGLPPSHSSGGKVDAFVRAAPDIQTRNSMVAGSAHTAGPALCLGVPALRRDQVELLLCLVQAEADALLVE